MYFVLITELIQCRKESAKTTAKSYKKKMTIFKDGYFRIQTWVCQNVSNEILLAWFKFQIKTPSRSGVCNQEKWQKYTHPSPLLSKDKRLRNMNIGNLILVANSVTIPYLIHYDSLLQNATDITAKGDSYFITKCDRRLLQNATGFLSQIRAVSTKCGDFIINAAVMKNVTVITKYDSTKFRNS